MVHYAEIDPDTNVVKRVIVCESKEWCETTLGGTWVRTYYATPGKNYAGTGYSYHPDKDNFSPPRPFASWFLDDNCLWKPPVPYPSDGGPYTWNEEAQTWDRLSNI